MKEKQTFKILISKLETHLYIFGFLLATLFSIILFYSTQKKYAAYFTISDEHRSTDLLIGLTPTTGWLNQRLTTNDQGLDKIYVYLQIIKSDKFLGELANTVIPSYKITYAEHILNHKNSRKQSIDIEYAKECISNNISYKINDKYYIATISVEDKDPKVALYISKKINFLLYNFLDKYKKMQYAKKKYESYKNRIIKRQRYLEAEKTYTSFIEQNEDLNLTSLRTKSEYLNKQRDLALKEYDNANIQYYRDKALSQKGNIPYTVINKPQVLSRPLKPVFLVYEFASLFIAFVIITWLKLYIKGSNVHKWQQLSLS